MSLCPFIFPWRQCEGRSLVGAVMRDLGAESTGKRTLGLTLAAPEAGIAYAVHEACYFGGRFRAIGAR